MVTTSHSTVLSVHQALICALDFVNLHKLPNNPGEADTALVPKCSRHRGILPMSF